MLAATPHNPGPRGPGGAQEPGCLNSDRETHIRGRRMNKELRRFERFSIDRLPEISLCCWQPSWLQTSTNAPFTQPPPAFTREKGDAGNLKMPGIRLTMTKQRHWDCTRLVSAPGTDPPFSNAGVETDNALRSLTNRVTIKNDRTKRMLRQENEARDPLEKRQRFPGPCPLERVGAPASSHLSPVPGATLYDAFVQISGRETGAATPESPDDL